MHKPLVVTVACFLLVAPIGCGSDSNSKPPSTAQTGYIIGGLVENLEYVCGEHRGRTGRLGEFTYQPGRRCTFRLGALELRVPAAALEDGSVTPYDMTRTPTAAWTLMAILDGISYRRPTTALFTVVDGILAQRVPRVDLRRGDPAIAAALAPFKGTTKAVSVASGRARLGEFVDENNVLKRPLEDLVAAGEEALASLNVAPRQGQPPPLELETDHDNVVNLRVYNYEGNPLTVNSVSYQPGQNDTDWLWVTDGQNPNHSEPVAGLDQGDITGPNIFGIDLDVGRVKSTQVGTSFMDTAQSPGTWASPVTILAYGATDDESNNTYFPQELNFGYHIDLTVNTSAGTFACPNIMFGQGSTSPSLKTFLNLVENIGDTIFDGFEFVASDGSEGGEDTVQSFGSAVHDALDIKYQNWWILGLNAQNTSYRAMAWGYPVLFMQCFQNGNTIPVLGYSDYDDHTFNLQVSFPGQPITVTQ